MVIFFYGEDEFRSQEKLKEIKDKFLEKTRSGSSLSVVDFEDSGTVATVAEAISAGGLFSTKRLVVIKKAISSGAENQKQVLEFLKKHEKLLKDEDAVVVFWEGAISKGKSKLVDYLTKNTKKQLFEKLTGKKLQDWTLLRIKKYEPNIEISLKALEKLLVYVGNDLFHLDNEIQKLVNYKERGRIEEEDIDLLVKASINTSIFEAVEALSGGNKKRALDLFHLQLQQGEDAFRIFSMYVYQFRNLLKIADYYFQGQRNQYEIAKLAKLHPFVVGKGMLQLRNYSLNKLKDIYKKLEEMDVKSKTGKVDLELEIDKMIVEI